MNEYDIYKNDIEKLEEICSEGVNLRFRETIIVKDHFNETIKQLNNSDKIMLITGFCIKDALIGETDGPIGTVCLAKALLELGKEVVIVTDKYSENFIEAGRDHYNLDFVIKCVDMDFDKNEANKLMDKTNPNAVLFIERPSKNKEGNFCSMSAESITGIIPDTDHIFELAKASKIPVIAIGDGGNEVGMDLIRETIIKNVDNGELICARTKSDLLIVSGVSNWACYTIVGGLSIVNNKNLLPTVNQEIEHLYKIVELGAVDGVSKKSLATVDGYSLNRNMQILKDVAKVVFKVEHENYIS